jgi:hypothetical protein
MTLRAMGMSEGKDNMSFSGQGVQEADNSSGKFSGRMTLQGQGGMEMRGSAATGSRPG